MMLILYINIIFPSLKLRKANEILFKQRFLLFLYNLICLFLDFYFFMRQTWLNNLNIALIFPPPPQIFNYDNFTLWRIFILFLDIRWYFFLSRISIFRLIFIFFCVFLLCFCFVKVFLLWHRILFPIIIILILILICLNRLCLLWWLI